MIAVSPRSGGRPSFAASASVPPAEPGAWVRLPQGEPLLVVLVDAEEEFDWRHFSSDCVSVRNIAEQYRAQRLFERFGCRPTYLVDFAVASQPQGYQPLRDYLESGRCGIGAQLHPWVTPPLTEDICARNSFAGNLPAAVEFQKIARLTDEIETNLGCRPILYRAGRYGTGAHSVTSLIDLGYRMECSVVPFTSFAAGGGPDYRRFGVAPYWLDRDRTLMELPLTCALIGRWAGADPSPFSTLVCGALARYLHVPGLLARFGLINRVRLSPEGFSLEEAKALTLALLSRGQRLFHLTYHSSSLLPGGSPYVRTERDRDLFLGWIEAYLDFFLGEIAGRPATPEEIYALARSGETRDSVSEAGRGGG
ncbi:polysaccharide deacetylase family protein [Magnetospirillum molischianum]|uniref:WalW protein n=1 Tax=Magnetospirillum molischianum DSM 120 TaxID=1150626 RepID=H8FQB9_MAGML|nr:polysaccharide deacetylase family protein [Magnetospirillum molischianum]CCG40557.1 WalW protein [Magnetospirillum molischianum DSM 120]